MEDNDETLETTGTSWAAPRTAKEKHAVQRAVDQLLDALAPERTLARADRPGVGTIERHRTPTGCVLQAPTAAVSVSWFADAANDATLGELHIVVWRGVVTRRGTAPRPGGATVVGELVVRPAERPSEDALWRAADGTSYDTDALAARCHELLQEEVARATAAAP